MNFYYDILVNFQDEEVYEFYEWDKFDEIELLKKVPLFRVSSETIIDFVKYKIKVDSAFMDLIYQKTSVVKNGSKTIIDYAFLITDAKNSLVVELNEAGIVQFSSKLELSDDLNIGEIAYSIGEKEIVYEKISLRKKRHILRQDDIIGKFIKLEIETLYEVRDELKLRYLYSEWFFEEGGMIDEVYEKLKDILKEKISFKHYELYKLIKLSYQNSSLVK